MNGFISDTQYVLLPTAYLPPLEYMVWLYASKKAVVELHETYQRQTWRNRCSIYAANGRLDLIIPVDRPDGNSTKTCFVKTSKHTNWPIKHWRSITAAYNNAPFFIYYKDLLEPFYRHSSNHNLWEFNMLLLKSITDELSINTHITRTSSYESRPEKITDLRAFLTPKSHRRSISQSFSWPTYHQTFAEKHGFIPNLSIVDLLFHMGPDTMGYLKDVSCSLLNHPSEG